MWYVHSLEGWGKERGACRSWTLCNNNLGFVSEQLRAQGVIIDSRFCVTRNNFKALSHLLSLPTIPWGGQSRNYDASYFQVSKMRLRKAKWFFQSHKASEQSGWDQLESGSLSHTLEKKAQDGSCLKLLLEMFWSSLTVLMEISWQSAESKNSTWTYHLKEVRGGIGCRKAE